MRYRTWGLSILAVAALLIAGLGGVAAQDEGGALDDLSGLPELTITLTDTAIEGVPAETEAGWHLVTFTNGVSSTGDDFEDAWSIEFIMLPEGMAASDLAGPPEGAASPVAGGEDPFAFLYETYLAGGPGALRGETAQGLIFLEPGDYAVNAFTETAPPVPLTVTEAAADATAQAVGDAVAADITISESGTSGTFDFAVDTGDFAGGPATIAITNESDQPHFIISAYSPNPITEDEVMTLLMSDENATPAPGDIDPSTLRPSILTGTQSTGTTQDLAGDLEPGYYALLCFIGDPNLGGAPHSFTGMIEVFSVGV